MAKSKKPIIPVLKKNLPKVQKGAFIPLKNAQGVNVQIAFREEDILKNWRKHVKNGLADVLFENGEELKRHWLSTRKFPKKIVLKAKKTVIAKVHTKVVTVEDEKLKADFEAQQEQLKALQAQIAALQGAKNEVSISNAAQELMDKNDVEKEDILGWKPELKSIGKTTVKNYLKSFEDDSNTEQI